MAPVTEETAARIATALERIADALETKEDVWGFKDLPGSIMSLVEIGQKLRDVLAKGGT